MLTLLAEAPARLPSAGVDGDHAQYVWSGNTAALIGAALCGLLLIAWFKYVGFAPVEDEEES